MRISDWSADVCSADLEIERVAGCSILEIHNLYGPNAYRRYERRALEEAVQLYPEMVLATPGGLVSEPATLNLLLPHRYTVWLRATPDEPMARSEESRVGTECVNRRRHRASRNP